MKEEQLYLNSNEFGGLNSFIFSSENMKKFEIKERKKDVVVKKEIKDKDLKFNKETDDLFWCFYEIIHMDIDYLNKFTTEKKYKLEIIPKLREIKDLLKSQKVKIAEIEDELANKQKITLKTLKALCIINKISLIIIKNRTYIEFMYGDKIHILEEVNKRFGYYINNSTKIEEIRNFYRLEDYEKKIKSISSYTVKDLQEIAKKLEINLVNNMGKTLKKTELYEEICQNLH